MADRAKGSTRTRRRPGKPSRTSTPQHTASAQQRHEANHTTQQPAADQSPSTRQLRRRHRKRALAPSGHIQFLFIFVIVLAFLAIHAPSVPSSFAVPLHPDDTATNNATATAEAIVDGGGDVSDAELVRVAVGASGMPGGSGDGHIGSTTSHQGQRGQQSQKIGHSTLIQSKPGYMWRFPKYGTDEFAETCSWTQEHASVDSQNADCTLLVRPDPKSNEGIAEWIANVVHGYIFAVQLGCRLVTDYGADVDLNKCLIPPVDGTGTIWNNWTVPSDYSESCDGMDGCHKTGASWREKNLVAVRNQVMSRRAEGAATPEVASLPHYRFVYTFHERGSAREAEDVGRIREIERALPGFRYDTGMACAMGSTFALSPTASEFVPDLFTHILPALRDDSALVISLYLRTGRADKMLKLEQEGKEIDHESDATRLVGHNEKIIRCALSLEEDHLSGSGAFARSVWMVTSDSPNIGRTVVSLYDGKNVTVQTDADADSAESAKSADAASIPRTVLITAARGVQTKPQRRPQTADFAEAMIDWWLLGESDFVVALGSYSFASTAALRTARPIYVTTKEGCWKRTLPSSTEDDMETKFPSYRW